MRTLVIGGRGFWGGHIAKALAALPGCEVVLGSRNASGSARIDLGDPSTFGGLKDFDYVINCADTVESNPLSLIESALASGATLIETCADPATLERVFHAIRRPGSPTHDHKGRVLLGMGFMPGISNMLARSLVEPGVKPTRLELAVRSSSFAGGGKGMVALMIRALLNNSVRYEGGERIEDPPVSAGIEAPFFSGDHQTLRVGLPEAPMLRWSTGAASTGSYMAPKPGFMRYTASMLAAMAPKSDSGRRRFYSTLLGPFTFQRATLLRDKPTAVEVTAMLDRQGRGNVISKSVALTVNKGIEAGAFALAATVEALAKGHPMPPGLHLPEEIFELRPMIEAVERLSNKDVRFEIRGP